MLTIIPAVPGPTFLLNSIFNSFMEKEGGATWAGLSGAVPKAKPQSNDHAP